MKPTPEFKRGVRAAIRCVNAQRQVKHAVKFFLEARLLDLTKDGGMKRKPGIGRGDPGGGVKGRQL